MGDGIIRVLLKSRIALMRSPQCRSRCVSLCRIKRSSVASSPTAHPTQHVASRHRLCPSHINATPWFLCPRPAAPFMVVHGNHPEALRDLMVAWMARHPLAPLEDELVLVQSNGVAQWLKLSLAAGQRRRGHRVPRLQTELPSRFLWEAYRAVLGRGRRAADFALRQVAAGLAPDAAAAGAAGRAGVRAAARFLDDDDDMPQAHQLALRWPTCSTSTRSTGPTGWRLGGRTGRGLAPHAAGTAGARRTVLATAPVARAAARTSAPPLARPAAAPTCTGASSRPRPSGRASAAQACRAASPCSASPRCRSSRSTCWRAGALGAGAAVRAQPLRTRLVAHRRRQDLLRRRRRSAAPACAASRRETRCTCTRSRCWRPGASRAATSSACSTTTTSAKPTSRASAIGQRIDLFERNGQTHAAPAAGRHPRPAAAGRDARAVAAG
jgi:hypothetical protein